MNKKTGIDWSKTDMYEGIGRPDLKISEMIDNTKMIELLKSRKDEPYSDIEELYKNDEFKKYCPLAPLSKSEFFPSMYCGEHRCMWYNRRNECAIYGLDRSLTIIAEELLEIRKKLG